MIQSGNPNCDAELKEAFGHLRCDEQIKDCLLPMLVREAMVERSAHCTNLGIDMDLVNAMSAAGNDTVAMTAAVVQCEPCPIGTDCPQGSTLDNLPLRRGYFRLTQPSCGSCGQATTGT